jgi:PAS domain S-box-containing protein
METVTTQTSLHAEEILDNTRDGMFITDRERRILLFNRACERITGFRREEVLGRPCSSQDLTACEDQYGRSLMGKLCPNLRVLSGELPETRQKMRIRRRDGTHLWVETTYTGFRGPDGSVAWVLAVVQDISDLKRTEEELLDVADDLRGEVERLRGEIRQRYGFSTIISRSPSMEDVFDKIRAAATNSSAVLISGEPGTGKETIARTIHYSGLQKDGPFVPVNCAALGADLTESELFGHVRGSVASAQIDYKGLLRSADGGTVFLDEVTAIPLEVQAKLLRALEEKRVRAVGGDREAAINVRVIATINVPPADAVAAGTLRRDLGYHLGVVGVEVPPLRERKQDIPYLVEHFLSQLGRQGPRQVKTVAREVWPELLGYDWPGNVRELRGAMESALAQGTGPELGAAELPRLVRGETIELHGGVDERDLPLDDVLASVERQAILAALHRAGGQRSRAARAMSISRSRLYRRMEALGIHPGEDALDQRSPHG